MLSADNVCKQTGPKVLDTLIVTMFQKDVFVKVDFWLTMKTKMKCCRMHHFSDCVPKRISLTKVN